MPRGSILAQLSGVPWLVVSLLYGAGLRLVECLELRLKDIDVTRSQLIVRQGKGRTDRLSMLPSTVAPTLAAHIDTVQALHDGDLARGYGRIDTWADGIAPPGAGPLNVRPASTES
jgi:integrase